MSLPKLRDVGALGVINDLDPYDLPPNAFTMGVNVRFRNGRVTGSPVFKSVFSIPVVNPRYLAGFSPNEGTDLLFLGYRDGRVFQYSSGTQTDVSISGYAQSDAEAVWTSTFLGDVVYINRSDRSPWSKRTSDTTFASLANMDSAWTAQLLRTCGGALVALNVTKSTGTVQTMVKTSSMAVAGSVPSSWDITDPSTNATENTLAEMQGPIVDACSLGRTLCIYGTQETWQQVPTGDFQIFAYQKLPFTRGAINANCSVEVNSMNFIFGEDDLWKHDGVTDVSIADQRVRDFVFGGIDLTKANRCFVAHNRQLHEIHFNFVSGDAYTNFSSANEPDGCNRCAVYDYVRDTWTFDDRPVVYSASICNLDTVKTWADDGTGGDKANGGPYELPAGSGTWLGSDVGKDTDTPTWAAAAGPWSALDDTGKKVLGYIGDTAPVYSLTSQIYAFDPISSTLPGMPAAVVNYPVDAHANPQRYVERSAIDMTALGSDLRDYTQISGIWPLARIDASSQATLDFSVGSSDFYDVDPVYTDYQTYDGKTTYKIDVNTAGRYLSYRMRFLDYAPFSWSGFDFDVNVLGSR